MREIQQLFLTLRLVSEEKQQSAIQTKIEQHFGGFFPQIKGRQPIGRKDSKQNRDPNKQEVGFIFKIKIIKSKTFKAYPMIPLLG